MGILCRKNLRLDSTCCGSGKVLRSLGARSPQLNEAVLVIVVAAFASVCVPARAQVTEGTPSVIFSRPLSVRSAGMNGAGAALVDHAGAVFSNPAGIATIRHIGIEGAYRATPSDGSIISGAMAWRLSQFDVGLGIARFRPGIGTGANPLSDLGDARELGGVGTLVYRFGIIALAGSGRYVQRAVDESREDAFGADAGLAIALFDIMAIGVSTQNLGGRLGGESTIEMPGLTRVGMMWNYVDPLETFRLLSTVELQWPEGKDFRIVMGGEGGVVVGGVGLFGRAAYGSESTGSIFSHMSYGASLAVAKIVFDYAYQEKDFGGEPAHRFGFRLTL